ncbi:MAG: sensor histidine kinase [Muribaculaceae bacterium]
MTINFRRYGKPALLLAAVAVVATFLYVSTGLVRDLSQQERERMEIWADATREIVGAAYDDADTGDAAPVDIDFLLRIIQANRTIPVVLTDEAGNIIDHRNFVLPEPVDSLNPLALSPANEQFLRSKVAQLSHTSNVIDIAVAPGVNQRLYYEDSTLLKRLSYYPYVVIAVMAAFVFVVYFAVISTKKAEQNKVWVGLSKETAHQLGTPISSLMAWLELLPDMGVDADTIAEMSKDVNRLSTIASRFSKIGSVPQMDVTDLNAIVGGAVEYMQTRVSGRIALTWHPADDALPVKACAPLFEWVMENLIKNAVDAMEGYGNITVTTGCEAAHAFIEVADTGKGISRKNFKTVFTPGFTTKKRGWGLGLTLAKRIIAEYHGGDIYVKASTPGVGTTFRIDVPLAR